MSHISDPPFLIEHEYIHMSLQGDLSYFAGVLVWGFVRGILSGRFCLGWLLSVPLLLKYIRYNRQLNITCNFRFPMYEKICSWVPPSDTNCHTSSDPSPSRVTSWTAPMHACMNTYACMYACILYNPV